jgi:hypothetical protein
MSRRDLSARGIFAGYDSVKYRSAMVDAALARAEAHDAIAARHC